MAKAIKSAERIVEEYEDTAVITPERFVQILTDFLFEAKNSDTVSAKELKKLLARVALPGGGLSYNNIREAVIERVAESWANHNEQGIAAANLWRDISRKYGAVMLEATERVLNDLVEAGLIEEVANGVTTGYIPCPTEEPEEKEKDS